MKKASAKKRAAKKPPAKKKAKKPSTVRSRNAKTLKVRAKNLLPDPLNWHTHGDDQRSALLKIFEEVGFVGFVLVRRGPSRGRYYIIDGHERVEAIKTEHSEEAEVDCCLVDLSEDEARKILASHDSIGSMGGVDEAVMKELLDSIEFDDPDLDSIIESAFDGLIDLPDSTSGVVGELVEPDIPEPPADPITKPGDLIILGRHRLLCGDSTKPEDVARLMDGARAEVMNTDPPYGIAYNNEGVHPKPGSISDEIPNDDLSDEKLQHFLEACFRNAVDCALVPTAAWYMWHAHLMQGYFAAAAAAAAADVVLHRQIIWVKPVLVFGRGQFHMKHEPCFMGWVKGNQPPDYGRGAGERNQTTIWEIAGVPHSERKEYNHSTPKPVELFAIPIVKHTKPGGVLYEPFAGSGPQFIAAEQLNRTCYGMEISPAYCDVIVKRWEALTGQKASKQE